MKSLEVAVIRIYISNDEAHLEKVLEAIDDFVPSGDVKVFETRSVFDKSGTRLPPDQQGSLMIEFFEEQCRARMFVDGWHEDIKPATIVGSFEFLLEGDAQTESEAVPRSEGVAKS